VKKEVVKVVKAKKKVVKPRSSAKGSETKSKESLINEEEVKPKTSSKETTETIEDIRKRIEAEPTLDNLNVVAIDGIDEKYASRLKKAGITTLTDLVRADPFAIYEKTKLPIHKFMEFQKKAELILYLNFDEEIVDILAEKNYTIEKAIEEEPKVLKKIVQKNMTSVIEFLENLVQITIYLDAITCRTKSITILHRSRVESELTKEQMLAKIYSNQIGRAVLKLLQERARSKKELEIEMEDMLIQTKTTKTAFNNLLDLFVRTEIAQEEWINYEKYLFLIADFTIFRRPAQKIVEAAIDNQPTPLVAKIFLEEVNKFFSTYQPNDDDNLLIAQDLKEANIIDVLLLLREKSYPLKKFPRRPMQDATEIENLLKYLQERGIVKFIQDEQKVEWVMLITDITAKEFYPEYLIENIRYDTAQHKLNNELALKHLDLLERNYDTFFKVL